MKIDIIGIAQDKSPQLVAAEAFSLRRMRTYRLYSLALSHFAMS
jgi:hypothetical protein